MHRLALLLAAALPALVHAQDGAPPRPTNAERLAAGAYGRSHDYDLVHQDVSLGGFRWDSLSFNGRVATTLVVRRAATDSVRLDCGALLRVRHAATPAGRALRTAARGDTLVVYLGRHALPGDTVRFTLDYDGRVVNGRGLTFIQPDGRAHRPRQLWSQGESSDNHLWFPTWDFPDDKLTWQLSATVPSGYTAVSNGTLAADRRNADGTRTMTWRQASPSASYLVSLVVAPLVKVQDTWRSIPVDYYVYAQDSALARPLFRVTPDMIETYSRLTGVDYPWAKYAQTTVADFFGGMENVSATTLVDWLPDSAAYVDRPWYQHVLIPHELAHQWFGDYVTTASWAHMWLNEGFAEYMPGAYWYAKEGATAEDDYFVDEYASYLRIDAGRRMPLASYGSNAVYPKGALVVRMLQRQLGRERFWAAVHRYLVDHASGTAVTDDVRRAILDATGEKLDWFFDQWLYAAGHPEFRVRARYDSVAHTLALDVAQTQVDTGAARTGAGTDTLVRYTTPLAFRAPMTVRVGVAGGPDLLREILIDRREQTVTIDGLTTAPTMVVFDDDDHVLKTLDFEQPTSWLAAQAASPTIDLWNRLWAIDHLAATVADDAAVDALASLAIHGDLPRVRAQAAASLGSFAAVRALPPLEQALADSSSVVRAAVLEALARIGGPRAAALGRARYAADPSYTVRAAALGAAATDTTGRAALLAAAIGSRSYRDEVANAAIVAAVRAGELPTLTAMDARLGDLPLAAEAIAVLAARGSPVALETLVRHLDDERPFVRRNVVQAFQRDVPRAIAAPALAAAVDGLHHPETAAAVRALLATPTPARP